jgi:hypothetical protein
MRLINGSTRKAIMCAIGVALVFAAAGMVNAYDSYTTDFNNLYGTSKSCGICHVNPLGGGTRTVYGNDFRNNSRSFPAIEPLDSDGDGLTNIAEITAGTDFNDPNSPPDTTAPAVTAFAIPATGTSLTVNITTFTATDNKAVTGYKLTEAAAKPTSSAGATAGATAWTPTAPTSYSFATPGSKTLYAWAKDAAGNVSASRTGTIVITLPDTTAPTVTGLTIPATAASLTVSISSLTATDNIAVTGYFIAETATKPGAGVAGWTASAPASYTFSSAGAKTLYAWAKDGASNVSSSMSADVTITLPDAIAPMVTSFTIPATATSLTVSINSLTATDNAAVTRYFVAESATAPLASAIGWLTAVPAAYTFSSAGAKTLYAWAKDAAGNVSDSRSADVTITLPDAIAPMVTAFVMPSSSISLNVPVTTFTASDDIGVTGYRLTETATKPGAGAAGWNSTAPTGYNFASAGTWTLYAWAKDVAGNVSDSRSASVTITLPDGIAPEVTAFTIPATATSLTVPINSLTATDNAAVTGYLLTEASTTPNATATGWKTTPPASYVFASAGVKDLNAWAKDAAGNVSARKSASVSITLPTPPPSSSSISVGPKSLDFGEVEVSESKKKALKITNKGTTPVTITGVRIDADEFRAHFKKPVTLPVHGKYTLQVTFKPTDSGLANGTLTITVDNQTVPSAMISLRGIGESDEGESDYADRDSD